MKYYDDMLDVFGPFWPVLLLVMFLFVGSVGAWLMITTWRENRRTSRLEQTLKKNVYEARI